MWVKYKTMAYLFESYTETAMKEFVLIISYDLFKKQLQFSM